MNLPDFQPEDFDPTTLDFSEFEENEAAYPADAFRVLIANPAFGEQLAFQTTVLTESKRLAILDALDQAPDSVIDAMVESEMDQILLRVRKMPDSTPESEQFADKQLLAVLREDFDKDGVLPESELERRADDNS